MNLSTEVEWARSGTSFSPQSRSDKAKHLPSGVYRFVATMQGWYLDRVADQFHFPFKVYDASSKVIDRIITYWYVNGGNLGILMNGLRGAGKTMTAQLLANKLIKDADIPVLAVREPVPLQAIFDAVQQNMMVIFDEFEKTHDDENQKLLLSTIDGMSRSAFNRLIVFTTNVTAINENFRDRPSRIHYQFEFQRVADEIIEGLIEDGLEEDLRKKFKADLLTYLHTRKICTIDIVKAAISEVRTFRESPTQFEEMLNISKGEPPAFEIDILNPETNTILSNFHNYFRPDAPYSAYSPMLSGNKHQIKGFIERGVSLEIISKSYDGCYSLLLLEKCPEEHCWLAQLSVPKSKTPFDRYEFLYDGGHRFFHDNKPEDWNLPTVELTKDNDKARKKVEQAWNTACNTSTVHGTRERRVYKVRVTPNHEAVNRSRYQVSDTYGYD